MCSVHQLFLDVDIANNEDEDNSPVQDQPTCHDNKPK